MLEYFVVNYRDVEGWKYCDKTSDDGPKQELVTPNVEHPLRKVLFTLWLHPEERAPHIDHLPGKEKGKPRQTDKRGRAGTENSIAVGTVSSVAIFANVAISKTVKDQDERRDT